MLKWTINGIQQAKEYFGFVEEEAVMVSYPKDFKYRDQLGKKLEYLKSLAQQEDERRITIDTKTSQVIGQIGIVFSLISLFVPTYLDKFNQASLWVKITLIAVFAATLGFYLLAMLQATKYLNIKKHGYGQYSTATVRTQYLSDDDFLVEEIKDLIFIIEKNSQINHQKGDCLIYAYRSFRLANFMVGLLVFVLLFGSYFIESEHIEKVDVANPITISGLDSNMQVIKRELEGLKTSILQLQRNTIDTTSRK